MFVKSPPLFTSIPSRARTVCSTTPAQPSPTPPPNSLSSTVTLATAAISKAIQDGNKRLVISALIPGVNPALEQNFPFSVSLLNTLAKSLVTATPELKSTPTSLIFQSAGTAAAAAAQFSRDDQQSQTEDGLQLISTSSYASRDISRERTSPHTNVIVNPVSSCGDPIVDDLENVISENPEATWLLFNPQLDVDRAAVGMRENTRRAAFVSSFTNTFYYRPLFQIKRPVLNAEECGALLFCYGQQWDTFALVEQEYFVASQADQMPLTDEITTVVQRCAKTIRNQQSAKTTPASGFDVELSRFFKRFGL